MGCGGGSSSSSGASDDGLSGNWAGSMKSRFGFSGNIVSTIKHSGDRLSGTMRVTSISRGFFTCFGSNTPISGTVNGSKANITVSGSGGKVFLSGNISGNKISGNYQTVSGICSGDRGTFFLKKS